MRLTTLSQRTLECLFELHLEVITSVLTSAAAQLERVLEIFTLAGRGVRTVARDAYEDAAGSVAETPAP